MSEEMELGTAMFRMWGDNWDKRYYLCKPCANFRGVGFGDVVVTADCWSCKRRNCTVQDHSTVPDWTFTEEERKAYFDRVESYRAIIESGADRETIKKHYNEFCQWWADLVGVERAAEFERIVSIWT